MKRYPYPIETVLPHAHPMILIDDIVGYDESSLTSALTIRPEAKFFRPGRGVAAHIGLEWMAQTCGAFAGARALECGEEVRLGLLLGTRDFTADVMWFPEGERLHVTATQLFVDGRIGAFDCAILRAGGTLPAARAQLTVYQPLDAAALLADRASQADS
jgi:predicted hotdog family 3-hydroxylacyl-ACP dehydratase